MFDNTKSKGQLVGTVTRDLLTRLAYFVMISCILSPVCHIGSFMAGFSEGFSKKRNIARTY